MESWRPHLNLGFKVVSQASAWRRTYFPSADAAPELPAAAPFRAKAAAATMTAMPDAIPSR